MREITRWELRNRSGAVMRGLDAGETFIVTRNGVPVGRPTPIRRSYFVDGATVHAAFGDAPPIDAAAFRRDVDAMLDRDSTPHAGEHASELRS